MTTWADLPITPEHATFLSDQAVTADMADAAEIFSITELAQVPEAFAWAGERAVPAIAFPWHTPGGDNLIQIRPDKAIEVEGEDRPRKYLWPKGSGAPIGEVVVVPGDTIAFVEGTKQALAFAGYVTSMISVYAIAGCRTWSEEGVPVADLDVAEGKNVLLCFDADIESNPDVWEAAKKFTAALQAEGAASVKYVILPAGNKAGLDDVLGSRAEDKRTPYLERLIAGADKSLPKKPQKKALTGTMIGTPDRPWIPTNWDRHIVVQKIMAALMKWDGTRVFNYGGVMSELTSTGSVDVLSRDKFAVLLGESATCASLDGRGNVNYGWPDPTTLGAAMTKADYFTELLRVSRMPLVRPDGTIMARTGYDPETKTQVILPEDLEGLEVPEDPTADQLQEALELVCEDWLADFMPNLPTPADKANLVGLMLTPLIRGLVPLVPLAVLDGLQAGVGKNLLADLLAILVTGEFAQPLPYATNDDETRKVITSAFRTGAELFIFDEAHVIEGPSFARALTSVTYQDRVLGASNMAEFPNNVTWMSLGNQVVVNGDMSRRVYRINLSSGVANPMDRAENEFVHPDIRSWTKDNRAEIVGALLTLIRGWFAAGVPGPREPITFGSFEQWAKIVGGVLHTAGLEGFLTNLVAWRSESDFDKTYWADHLRWLHQTFGDDKMFTCSAVQKKLLENPDADLPPRMKDVETRSFARELGQTYARHKSRIVEGLMIKKNHVGNHANVIQWSVVAVENTKSRLEAENKTFSASNASDPQVFMCVEKKGTTGQHVGVCIEGEREPHSRSQRSSQPLIVDALLRINARRNARSRFTLDG